MKDTYNLDGAFRDATQTTKVIATAAGANTFLISRSRDRIALHIYGMSAAITYINTSPMTAINQGAAVLSTNHLHFTQRDHGDLATEEFHGFSTAGNILFIVEVFSCPCATGH